MSEEWSQEPELVNEDPDRPNFLNRGMLLFEQRRYDLAEKEFQQELQMAPGNCVAHAYLALCLLEQKRYAEGTRAAERAIEADPDNGLGYYATARAYRRRNHPQKAEAYINQALGLRPDDSNFLAMAAALATDRKDWDEALRLANEGLACDPDSTDCQNLRAVAMIRKGQLMPAREALLELLSRHPENSLTLANLGWVALHRGQRQEALDYFSRSLAEDAEDEYARDGLLEAMRLQYPLYGFVLKYMLWTARLSDKAQWAVTVGLYFLRQALEELARSHRGLRPFITVILWGMSIFNYLTWTARPVTTLLLRLNPYGRRILNQDEIDESNIIGGALAGAGGFYLAHYMTGRSVWMLASLVLFTIVMPASSIYNCEKGWRRTVMGVFTAVLLFIGAWGTWSFWDAPLTGNARTLFSLYGLGLLVSHHLGNLLAGSKDKQ